MSTSLDLDQSHNHGIDIGNVGHNLLRLVLLLIIIAAIG